MYKRQFLDGRFIRILMAPAKTGGRAYLKVIGAGLGAVTAAMTKVLGAQVLKDLQASGTRFVVVAAPERDALREASYFVERLGEERMPLAGLVLNRVHTTGARSLSAARSTAGAETLEDTQEHAVAAGILRLHADRMRMIEREQSLRGRFTAAHPAVAVVDVAAQPGDVHDLAGLRVIGAGLAGLRV